MNASQLNLACASFQSVNKLSLHIGDPGTTGENDSGITHETIVWGSPTVGVMAANVLFEAVPADDYTHVGFWDDAVFIHSVPYQFTVDPDPIDVTIALEHRAEEKL